MNDAEGRTQFKTTTRIKPSVYASEASCRRQLRDEMCQFEVCRALHAMAAGTAPQSAMHGTAALP